MHRAVPSLAELGMIMPPSPNFLYFYFSASSIYYSVLTFKRIELDPLLTLFLYDVFLE